MAKRSTRRVSFIAGVGSALAFIPRGLWGAWIVLLAQPILGALSYFYPAPRSLGAPEFALAVVVVVLALVARLMSWGALYRLSTRSTQKPGIGGVQWTGTEWRIIWAGLLTGLLSGLLLGLFELAIVLVMKLAGGHPTLIAGDLVKLQAHPVQFLQGHLGHLTAVSQSLAGWINLIGAGVLILLMWIIRSWFVLYLPATVFTKRAVVADAPRLASGSMLPLMLGMLFCSLPGLLWDLGTDYWTFDGAVLSAWAPGLSPAQASGLGLAIAPALLIGMLQPLLAAGFFGYAYRAATGRLAPAAETAPAAA